MPCAKSPVPYRTVRNSRSLLVKENHFHFSRLIAVLCILAPHAAHAHGDVHEEIAEFTKRIAASPADAKLYLQRGELHRAHQDWPAAAADFDKAEELDPALVFVDLSRGEMLGEAGRTDAAKAALDRFLSRRPDDATGYAARAQVLAQALSWEAAAEDFARAIAHAKEPEPALFIERGRAFRAMRKMDDAIRALDEGIARMGPLIVLMQAALDLETEAGRTDAALARIGKIIDASPRKERWLTRRGALLEKAGRTDAAREAFAAAQSALATVPADRRSTAAMQDLAKSIDAALARIPPAK